MVYVVTGVGNTMLYYHCFSLGTLVKPLNDQEGVGEGYINVEPLYPSKARPIVQTLHIDDLERMERYESPLWKVLEGKR